ncbi:penicillin acylase family protein [Mucilaginibacter sp. HMF5004]|uniref:penicillin acylase family protein n=1 Tax=Mucilaginibacter rivuli TaxID=2857527 RepID=UPI001C5FBBDF|nr:penicillin acylase family protein [Mucilaginibacter rivuli]MBW4889088.1 penicillin acylase family protein [Mucilaginibacter rivuli]
MRLKIGFLWCLLLPVFAFAQRLSKTDIARCEAEAKSVTIIRDNWGVPHIYAKTDAAVVFGLLYSECEDNFKGVERNYLNVLGRTAEADGESAVYNDLLMRLAEDTTDAIKDYQVCQPYFKNLLNAFADGVNYYLYKHPDVKPEVLTYFKPWYALMFTDGSVGATITGGATVGDVERFYGKDKLSGYRYKPNDDLIETGSNGFAIAPSKSATGAAMLYINPHVPFYFRSEVELNSEEGLHTYGAVTWGQFFVYQGFNEHCGWMHTTSNADVADLYAEAISKSGNDWTYLYNNQQRPVTSKKEIVKYIKNGQIQQYTFTTYYTHHGPVMGSRDGKWLTLKANNRSLPALVESWQITKAKTFDEYKAAMSLVSNATNNTVYADDKGNTALWYGNFVPKRDPKIDWTLPVDGTTPATEWQGIHKLDEIVHVYDPESGFIQNCNATPYAAAGKSSPDRNQYPAYMAPDGQNFRGVAAIGLLKEAKKLTLDSLIAKGYDKHLAAFDVMLPPLFTVYEQSDDKFKDDYADLFKELQAWDKRASTTSVVTTLAVLWGNAMMAEQLPRAKTVEEGTYATDRIAAMAKNTNLKTQLNYLLKVVKELENKYGTWRVPWGNINRYQRPADGVFDDKKPSMPVGQVSSAFGQLPSYVSKQMPGTEKRYGYSGNSFVAAVEFGKRIKAKSIITGGQSFDPASKNYTDQAKMYIDGQFKDVLFYKEDVLKHAERTYHPGE